MLKKPDVPVVTASRNPVSALTAVTVVPGSTPPVSSLTLPRSVPVVDWATAIPHAAPIRKRLSTRFAQPDRTLMTPPLSHSHVKKSSRYACLSFLELEPESEPELEREERAGAAPHDSRTINAVGRTSVRRRLPAPPATASKSS